MVKNMSERSKFLNRFVKETGIPINVTAHEGIFNERMKLFDPHYDTFEKLKDFEDAASGKNINEYYEMIGRIRDKMIEDIKNSGGFYDLNNFKKKDAFHRSQQYPKSFYQIENVGKEFISIDMRNANFSAMRFLSKDMFNCKSTWEEFAIQYTDKKHIINSKYLRQVVLGNCNPKKVMHIEQHLIDILLSLIEKEPKLKDRICCVLNDEIIIEGYENLELLTEIVDNFSLSLSVPFKIEKFRLEYLGDGLGFVKRYENGTYKLKCVHINYMAMVTRLLDTGKVKKQDLYFTQDGDLVKYTNIPYVIRGNFGIKW